MSMQMLVQMPIKEDETRRPLLDAATLYRRHVTMVRRRAVRLLGNDPAVQQITQDAFIKLLEHREWGGTPQQLAAYLYRTVTNLALNHLREGQRQRELSALRSRSRKTANPPAPDAAAVLREILALVSYDEAQVAAYYYVDGMECAEVAALLGIEARTVQKRLACFEERAPRLLGVAMRVQHVA